MYPYVMGALEMCVIDGTGTIVAVNATWRRFAEENAGSESLAVGVGMNYLDVTRRAAQHDGVAQNILEQLEALLASRRRFSARYPCHAPKRKRWFELTGEPLEGLDAAPRYVLTHRLLAPLDPSQIGAEAIVEALDEGFVALDAEQRIVMFNRAAERIFGIPAHEVLGGRVDRFLPAPVRAKHSKLVASQRPGALPRKMAPGERFVGGLRADGTSVLLSARIGVAEYGGDYLHIALLRDMTNQQAMEEREEALRVQLERSQRFEALGQLAGGLAHEMNNALAVVLANASLLNEQEREAQAIRDSARHAAGVVRQLLVFACGVSEEPSNCNLVDETRRSVELLRATLPVSLDIGLALPEREVAVAMSGQEVRQVLFNLLVNASHAMGGKGRIEVSVECQVNRVVLRVQDDGPGVAPSVVDRLFDPFVSTKPAMKGSGLGLSVVYGIASRRGGSIQLTESSLGGAAFELTVLPAAEQATPDTKKGTPGSTPDGASVLVVDDQRGLARALARLLRSRGLQVTVAHRCATARAQLAAGRYDVLLSDHSMPDGHGLDLVREARASGLDIACAILTGSATPELERQAHELDCALAAKPIGDDELFLLLRRAIALAPPSQ